MQFRFLFFSPCTFCNNKFAFEGSELLDFFFEFNHVVSTLTADLLLLSAPFLRYSNKIREDLVWILSTHGCPISGLVFFLQSTQLLWYPITHFVYWRYYSNGKILQLRYAVKLHIICPSHFSGWSEPYVAVPFKKKLADCRRTGWVLLKDVYLILSYWWKEHTYRQTNNNTDIQRNSGTHTI